MTRSCAASSAASKQVGWVEPSGLAFGKPKDGLRETHHLAGRQPAKFSRGRCRWRLIAVPRWVSLRSTHPTGHGLSPHPPLVDPRPGIGLEALAQSRELRLVADEFAVAVGEPVGRQRLEAGGGGPAAAGRGGGGAALVVPLHGPRED